MKTYETYKEPFTIYIPATIDHPPIAVEEIMIDVYVDESGEEMVTTESSIYIERRQAYHMGLMTGDDIFALRKKLKLTQAQLADYLKCGKKSISRWENGKGYPSGLVNKLLRLIDEGHLSLSDLSAVEGPRKSTQLSTSNLLKVQSISSLQSSEPIQEPECYGDNTVRFPIAS